MNAFGQEFPVSERSREVTARVAEPLKNAFTTNGLVWGSPVFLRIFKDTKRLETWVKKEEQFVLFKSYPICHFSGQPGPKTKEGDLQAPEGFYEVKPSQMNPNSDYHLSFNLGYPNVFDLAQNYTGSYLMVHGKCVSVGCYAMTDERIEEIYTLIQSAFEHGQASVAVHAFPFEMTAQNLSQYHEHPYAEFWKNLSEGYTLFEKTALPPRVNVKDKKYVFE
ncbi:L,D-transpeptidase family protein [Runella sp.]|uniref:L,D-transpeptidase family protein n=1 Tax=Runella sp. TaxID=1960881 RepID=UPI003D13A4D3